MDKDKIINSIAAEIKEKFENESSGHKKSGHDWWHIYRTWQLAKNIAKKENANIFIVELSALLHDIADWKFHDGDETIGPKEAKKILIKYTIDTKDIAHICDIIASISFKGAKVNDNMATIEGKVVQDADRLDAIGAIGIARCFACGASMNHYIHIPDKKPELHETKEEYFNSKNGTINHFYEKLLLLKDKMNTKTGKTMAKNRHIFMETFLNQFFKEWEGKM